MCIWRPDCRAIASQTATAPPGDQRCTALRGSNHALRWASCVVRRKHCDHRRELLLPSTTAGLVPPTPRGWPSAPDTRWASALIWPSSLERHAWDCTAATDPVKRAGHGFAASISPISCKSCSGWPSSSPLANVGWSVQRISAAQRAMPCAQDRIAALPSTLSEACMATKPGSAGPLLVLFSIVDSRRPYAFRSMLLALAAFWPMQTRPDGAGAEAPRPLWAYCCGREPCWRPSRWWITLPGRQK